MDQLLLYFQLLKLLSQKEILEIFLKVNMISLSALLEVISQFLRIRKVCVLIHASLPQVNLNESVAFCF